MFLLRLEEETVDRWGGGGGGIIKLCLVCAIGPQQTCSKPPSPSPNYFLQFISLTLFVILALNLKSDS